MDMQKKVKLYYFIAIGLTILVINQFSANVDGYGRYLNSEDKQSVEERINDEEVSNTGSKDIYAVINTPKMGTGGLTSTIAVGCRKTESNVRGLATYDCPHGRKAIRSHIFDVGFNVVEEHRKDNPAGKCLIVTAIRSPATWFASHFAQTLGCNMEDWPSEEALLIQFRAFIQNSSASHISTAIPGLLNEFGGGSLQEQFKIMDAHGGYSLLGPAPPQSTVAGCKLLFLRMEQNDHWPAIFKKVDQTIDFRRGEAKTELCPNLNERMKIIKNYELTIAEKNRIYEIGNKDVKDWFDAYGYTTQNLLNDQVIAQRK